MEPNQQHNNQAIPMNLTTNSSSSPPASTLIVDWDEDADRRQARNRDLNTRLRRRQAVGFCETTHITKVPGLWQMFDEDIASTYYSEEDFQRFKKDVRSNVKRMRKGYLTDSNKYTGRGLEHLASSDVLRQLQGERETLIELIFEAQERGMSAGDILTISARASLKAAKRAQRKALKYETEAKKHNSTSCAATPTTTGTCTDTAKFNEILLRRTYMYPKIHHEEGKEAQTGSKLGDFTRASTEVTSGESSSSSTCSNSSSNRRALPQSRQLAAQLANLLLEEIG